MGRPYDKRSWRRIRDVHLSMEPLCRTCMARGVVCAATQVDHIVALDDGGELLDHNNMQSLCDVCHGRKTRVEHGARVRVAFGVDGYPIDHTHHWNDDAPRITNTCDVTVLGWMSVYAGSMMIDVLVWIISTQHNMYV